jgi:FG-GAP-like repeat
MALCAIFPVRGTDFNNDGMSDYLLFNPITRQTAVWYLNNSALVSGTLAPTIPAGWNLIAEADFNSDSHPDYVLSNPTTRQTAIWYLTGNMKYPAVAMVPLCLPTGSLQLSRTSTGTATQILCFSVLLLVKRQYGI